MFRLAAGFCYWPRLGLSKCCAGGSAGQISVLNAALGNEAIGQTADCLRRPLDNNDLQTVVLVKVNVGVGIDVGGMFVLLVGELMLYAGDVVVVDQGDGANHGALGVFPLSLDQIVADKIADGLRPVLVAGIFDELVEAVQ